MKTHYKKLLITAALAVLGLVFPANVLAHCDTLDGPVVMDARTALESGDITPVLKWVQSSDEAAIKALFKQALEVRSKGEEAKNLADNYFFETVVRVHRAGEGAPYTGLKPAGSVEPAIAAADKTIETGSVDELAEHIASAAKAAVKERFEKVYAAKTKKDQSVKAGREYVEAYVQYIHFVEGLHNMIAGQDGHGQAEAAASTEQHQH
ncbi:MAG: DUF6448 family protein [Planctomycetaceae bacterium]|nr:DUF6448 family protein [Planctomycetaceae bacterium]